MESLINSNYEHEIFHKVPNMFFLDNLGYDKSAEQSEYI